MRLGLGLGINLSSRLRTLINKIIDALRSRATYFENEEETKIILKKLRNIDSSSAYDLLNKLEARSTYFENRNNTRSKLITIENIT